MNNYPLVSDCGSLDQRVSIDGKSLGIEISKVRTKLSPLRQCIDQMRDALRALDLNDSGSDVSGFARFFPNSQVRKNRGKSLTSDLDALASDAFAKVVSDVLKPEQISSIRAMNLTGDGYSTSAGLACASLGINFEGEGGQRMLPHGSLSLFLCLPPVDGVAQRYVFPMIPKNLSSVTVRPAFNTQCDEASGPSVFARSPLITRMYFNRILPESNFGAVDLSNVAGNRCDDEVTVNISDEPGSSISFGFSARVVDEERFSAYCKQNEDVLKYANSSDSRRAGEDGDIPMGCYIIRK